jgi:hypothetical protein
MSERAERLAAGQRLEVIGTSLIHPQRTCDCWDSLFGSGIDLLYVESYISCWVHLLLVLELTSLSDGVASPRSLKAEIVSLHMTEDAHLRIILLQFCVELGVAEMLCFYN